MPHLLIQEREYYSQRDEDHFFAWLEAIPGVTRIIGTPEGLRVTFRSKRLSNLALRDLLALHFRYGLTMTALAQFENQENTSWFRAPSAYWHNKVFQQ